MASLRDSLVYILRGLLLGEEVEVVVAAGAGVDDGGKIARDHEGVAVVVFAQNEGEFQGGDGGTDGSAVAPGLAEDGGFAVGGEGVEIGLAIVGIHGEVG